MTFAIGDRVVLRTDWSDLSRGEVGTVKRQATNTIATGLVTVEFDNYIVFYAVPEGLLRLESEPITSSVYRITTIVQNDKGEIISHTETVIPKERFND